MRKLMQMCVAVMALIGFSEWALAGPVNVNSADAETLAKELTGIGPALAAAIVRDREENGPYKSPEELTRVRGIGPSILENNKDNILVEDAPAASE